MNKMSYVTRAYIFNNSYASGSNGFKVKRAIHSPCYNLDTNVELLENQLVLFQATGAYRYFGDFSELSKHDPPRGILLLENPDDVDLYSENLRKNNLVIGKHVIFVPHASFINYNFFKSESSTKIFLTSDNVT